MKIKRQKRVRRIINYFKTHFGLKPPYRVLLDGTFTGACLSHKIKIREQIPKYLECEDLKFSTTPCCIRETDKLGPDVYGASLILKGLCTKNLLSCGHGVKSGVGGDLPAVKCVKSLAGKETFFVATQDPELRERVRLVPGVPIIYLHGNTPTLEEPSESSKEAVSAKREVTSYQEESLKKLKKRELTPEPIIKIKKRAKGPNPLSCLKSKKKRPSTEISIVKKTIRKRNKRSRIPPVL